TLIIIKPRTKLKLILSHNNWSTPIQSPTEFGLVLRVSSARFPTLFTCHSRRRRCVATSDLSIMDMYMDDSDPDEYSPEDQLQLAIQDDDKDKFIQAMSYFEETFTIFATMFPYSVTANLMGYVTEYNAMNCAAALLRGEAGLRVDLNVPLPHGSYPLHHAASVFSIHLIDLYLQHGGNTDVIYNGLLPLNVALEKLGCHNYLVDWTAKDSIFKLITILCLPQMKVPLEATKLLAQHTKKATEELFRYAKDGRPLQMAVLLMVARDIVMAPIYSQDALTLNGIMSLRRCIKEEIAALMQDEVDLAGKSRYSTAVKVFKEKRAGLYSALTMLDVFEKAGDAIDAYLQADVINKL
ncbi:hypothetical protein CFOL_v3_06749, partial [Cephalotus follicularis]